MNGLNMKAVLRQTGLSADRLRVWERRYGAVRPARAPNGRRVYREAEVQRLKLLATLVERGHAIGKIAGLPDDELLRQVGSSAEPKRNFGSDLADLLESLAHFDLEKMRAKFALLRHATSPREFAFEIIPQVMFLVGKKLDAGEFTIAEEHALSELLQGHLKRIYEDLAPLDGYRDPEGAFLFCTREGDPHDFGLLMAAIATRAAGFKAHYVGRSLPAEALIESVRRLRPRAIVLGLTSLPKEVEKISPQSYLETVTRNLDSEVEIWVGGPGTHLLKRKNQSRTLYVFESIKDLEEKLRLLASLKRG